MATLAAGYSFGATETCTNTKLGQLVSNGSISSITQTDIAAGEGLVYVGTSAPSDTDRVWVDTNSTPVVLRFYNTNLSAWVTSDNLAVYTNKSAQTGAAGRVVIFDTTNSNSYTYTSTAGDTKFLGIETGSIAANASAPVISRGSVVTNLELSASAGCYIRTSTATGKAEPCLNTDSGAFGFLTEAGTASARANIFGPAIYQSQATASPIFFVHRNASAQNAIPDDAWTKVLCFYEEFDIGGYFDNATNYRFTPLIAGKYQFNCGGAFNGNFASSGGTSLLRMAIFKNGSSASAFEARHAISNTQAADTMNCGGIFSANGSTDYFELYCRQKTGATADLNGSSFLTYFTGHLIK